METALGTFQADKKGASTPKRREVRPIHISSHERREIDEKTVADLVEALKRDGRFLHTIVVHEEGATAYGLIAGHHRLEAWKRHFGKLRPIPADVYPPDTPDALITILKIEENLLRKELTTAERQAQTIRLAAALKRLNGGQPVVPVSEAGEAAESGKPIPILTRARRGRGNKGMAQQVAQKVGIGKRAVNMRRKSAAAAIGEEIDLDRDTPEELERKAAELERKADKRQHAERKVVRLKRRKPAPGVEDPTPPADPHAGEIGSKIEAARKAFDALGRKHQLRFIHDACLHVGLDPLMMATPAVFGLADEESELAVDSPAEVPPASDDAPQDSLATDDAADDSLSTDDGAVDSQAELQDDAADLGAESLQDAGEDVSKAADQEPAGATKCAYCNIKFESGDQLEEFNGKLYHGFCVEDGKRLAKAKQGKQIAIAA